MALFDLPLDALRTYHSAVTRPDDFGEFWRSTLAAARELPVGVRLERVETGYRLIDTFDVTFRGFAGDPVRAWLRVPRGIPGPLPAVVQYLGYNGGRGRAIDPQSWPLAGYAHLLMDSRGQGATWAPGATADDPHGPLEPAGLGFLTRGIRDPEHYYYRRLYTDAVRAVDAVRSLDLIDAARVAVTGVSQGGGLALAVAGLVDGLVGVMADVPFLADFPRALAITDAEPFAELTRYLSVHRDAESEVFRTLAHVDVVNLVETATAPALISVALRDTVVPPSTVFAAYNRYAGEKEIVVYPFNAHEGGQAFQEERKLDWLRARA